MGRAAARAPDRSAGRRAARQAIGNLAAPEHFARRTLRACVWRSVREAGHEPGSRPGLGTGFSFSSLVHRPGWNPSVADRRQPLR